jgi:2-methylisocitrate lyase-like PEP mutase family enzyme
MGTTPVCSAMRKRTDLLVFRFAKKISLIHRKKEIPVTREQKYEAFKSLHQRAGAFVIPNPWNAGTAKILTALGFEALATTSAGYAFSAGHRDTPAELSRDEILQNAKDIVDATHLPVSADLQDGFGPSPETCAATIRLAAGIGLAGGSIEDATGDPDNPIYDFQLSVERVEAAAETAQTHHFLLTARAENFLHGRPNLDDTIRRLQSFAEAGADVLYAPGLPSLEAIREVCGSVSKPVNVLMGLKGATFSVEELAAVGVRRISVGGSFARAALGAFVRAAREVKDKGTFTYAADAISHDEASNYMGSDNR